MARDSENAARGQKIMSETGPDRSSDGEKGGKEALHGRSFAGGPKDLSHSLKQGDGDKPARKSRDR
jgi:hypothetical protein